MRVIDAIITRMKRKSTDVADVDFDADAAGIRDRNRNCIRNLYYLYNEQIDNVCCCSFSTFATRSLTGLPCWLFCRSVKCDERKTSKTDVCWFPKQRARKTMMTVD